MAKGKRPDQDTKKCSECRGQGTLPGDRYTDGEKVCPTCAGAGFVPIREKSGS